jgi:hypothetical protein
MKYLRREQAKACPVHKAVLEICLDELAEYGYFAKEDVIKQSGMIAVSESLRWDYLAEFIKSDGACELIPLAPRFWKMKPQQRVLEPEKAIAGGHGKKTAGYAMVGVDGGALAVRRLEHKRNLANGVGKAFRNFADELTKRELLEKDDQTLLESVKN